MTATPPIAPVATTAQSGRLGAVLRRAFNPVSVIALIFLLILIVVAILAPVIAPYNATTIDPSAILEGPSAAHWLGTDALGRDILSRLIYGTPQSLLAPLLALVVAMAIGIPIGLLGGYAGGSLDRFLSSVRNVLLAVPAIVVLLVVVSVTGRNLYITMLTLGILMSPNFMLLARNESLAVKEELFVDAAKVNGVGSGRIVWRHILPNIAPPLIVQASLTLAIALLISAGLGFLGLGAPPPAPSWGGMVSDAAQAYGRNSWMLIPTGGIIALTALALNLLGTGLRDAAADRSGARTRRGDVPTASIDTRGIDEIVPPSAKPLLSVEGISVSFGSDDDRTTVVSSVSFAIDRGQTLALVGESGSGKTISAHAILGLLAPGGRVDQGNVFFDGIELTSGAQSFDAVRGKRIGYVSQDPMISLDPAFRVLTQLVEPMRRHLGLSRSQAKAQALALLTAVGLPDPRTIARKYPFELSGGMAQRVAIAIGICAGPDLLIADEPTTALDVTTQAEILDLLRDLQAERGMALLLVTHDFGVVADLCDKAVVLYAGQVVENAATEELFAVQYHPYTKALLDSDPHLAVVGEPLPALPGTVVAPSDWPRGCRLADRCPIVTAACRENPIALRAVSPDRLSRCIRPHDVANTASKERELRHVS